MATVVNSISFEAPVEEAYRERFLNNIGKPLQCAGFYLNTAILQRIKLGLRIVKVEVVETLGQSDINLWVYEITHVYDVQPKAEE